MKVSIGQQTDRGPRKGENQDSILAVSKTRQQETITLLVVADGMGGANAGEHASRQAVEVIENNLLSGEDLNPFDVPERMVSAIKEANTAIYKKSLSAPEFNGMGCTVVVAVVIDDMYWMASVGDSRGYIIRDRQPHQITNDHTWVNARVQEGLLTPEQAENHHLIHVLDRALGVDEDVEIEIYPDDILEDGDVLVLCTDGLSGVLDDRTIAWVADNHPAKKAAKMLLQRALDAPARDNTSVIVMRAGSPEPAHKWSLEDAD